MAGVLLQLEQILRMLVENNSKCSIFNFWNGSFIDAYWANRPNHLCYFWRCFFIIIASGAISLMCSTIIIILICINHIELNRKSIITEWFVWWQMVVFLFGGKIWLTDFRFSFLHHLNSLSIVVLWLFQFVNSNSSCVKSFLIELLNEWNTNLSIKKIHWTEWIALDLACHTAQRKVWMNVEKKVDKK